METHFENIKDKVVQEIDAAEFIIYAAVAWITDFKIIDRLITKMKQGIQVELIINDDDRFEKRVSQFNDFRKCGGRLFLYKNDNQSIMHNKFCVIDLNTTITGSFNWSFGASTLHKENIVIVRENLDVARDFAREFARIKKSSILFEGKRNYYDVATYANIDYALYIEGDDGIFCHVYISQGDKEGIIIMSFCELVLSVDSPKKIYGFWKEKWKDKQGKAILNYYDFEVLDPNFIKYLN